MPQKALKVASKLIDSLLWTDFDVRRRNRAAGFHDPNYRFRETEIAFVHVPKTGGTSLHTLLRGDRLSRFVNLAMHRPVSAPCDPSTHRYITVMRDPVERVWSYYQMVVRAAPEFPYQRFARKGLEVFLKNCWEARDLACRYYSAQVRKEPTEPTVAQAFRNLEHFCCVIDFDDFARESTRLLARYDIPAGAIPHSRRSAYDPPSSRERELIATYNQFDVALFKQWKSRRSPSPSSDTFSSRQSGLHPPQM